MTKQERIIATAFTGVMFVSGEEMGELYRYMEQKLGRGVIDVMLAERKLWEELKEACREDFVAMVSDGKEDVSR